MFSQIKNIKCQYQYSKSELDQLCTRQKDILYFFSILSTNEITRPNYSSKAREIFTVWNYFEFICIFNTNLFMGELIMVMMTMQIDSSYTSSIGLRVLGHLNIMNIGSWIMEKKYFGFYIWHTRWILGLFQKKNHLYS